MRLKPNQINKKNICVAILVRTLLILAFAALVLYIQNTLLIFLLYTIPVVIFAFCISLLHSNNLLEKVWKSVVLLTYAIIMSYIWLLSAFKLFLDFSGQTL